MLSHDERPQAHMYGTMSSVRTSLKTRYNKPKPRQQRYVWVITGPAGCGKTTVAKYLRDHLDVPYVEGDNYHPASNVQKMADGVPLTDTDRWDWLVALRQKAVEELFQNNASGVVLTCSALKNKYRDVIRIITYNHHDVVVRFVYLRANEEVLLQRVKARKGHYMKEDMVHSQFSSLEEPEADEETDVLVIDVGAPEAEVKSRSLAAVQATLARDRAALVKEYY